MASVGVQVPIFSGGSTRARVASSHADLMSTEQELEAMRRQVLRETRTAFYGAEAGLSRISASRKALQSAEKSRVAAEQAFAYGVMNAVDVLDTVKEEYASRRDLLQSQYDFILNLMVLRRWSGTLVEEDVRKANAWLVAPDEP
ncbi:Outer membrane protein TolC precursor [compost metagenome]